MRYFVHPAPIAVDRQPWAPLQPGERDGPNTFTFRETVEQTIGNDPKAATTLVRVRRIMRILAAIEATQPGELIALEGDDWTMARELVEEPSAPFVPNVTRKLMPHFDALLGATEKKPEG